MKVGVVTCQLTFKVKVVSQTSNFKYQARLQRASSSSHLALNNSSQVMANKLPLPELKYEWAMWNLPKFNGSSVENPRVWIDGVDSGCQMRGISVSQRMITTIYFLVGSLKVVMKSVKAHLKSRLDLPSCDVKWGMFKNTLVHLLGESQCRLRHLILI
jgi:hypothetical protein